MMNNVALITGASSGIEQEIARIYAKNGGNLILVARHIDRLNTLKTELEEAHAVTALVIAEDLSDEAAPQRISEAVTQQRIQLNYLVNNAGFGVKEPSHEQAWDIRQSMIQVNAVSLAALTRLFLPDFIGRDRGRILNVTSTAALQLEPLQAIYFATTAFVVYLSNALVEELRDTKITIPNFMLNAIATEFNEHAGMAGSRWFQNTATSRLVAEEGYRTIMDGKMDAYGGMRLMRLFQYWLLRQLPKRKD